MITIGKNIKKLRKLKDITQEELALFLGISFQAISKWENGDTYPDITMLPALSNFFCVTIDELIGMCQIKNQENIRNIYKKIHELGENNNYLEAIRHIREALKIYPSEFNLMSELALYLSILNNNIEEAIKLSEIVLKNSNSEKVKNTTRANLCFLYSDIEKAKKLAISLPHIWESREMLNIELLEGVEYSEKLKETIRLILSIINDKITNSFDKVKRIDEIKKLIALGPQGKINSDKEIIANINKFLENCN